MLSDRCPVPVLSVLSVTLVYCGQTDRWIKMKLGTQVGLEPWPHCVRWEPISSPSPKGAQSQSPIFVLYLLRPNGWMDWDAT